MKFFYNLILVSVFLLFVITIPTEGKTFQEFSCTDCHDDAQVTSSTHKDFDCADCHSNIKELPHKEELLKELTGRRLCCQCHEDPVSHLNTSVHANLFCKTCHGAAHEIPKPSEKPCVSCHQVESNAFHESVHGEIMECVTCHVDSHKIIPQTNLDSPVSPLKQIETCGECHDSPPQLMEGFLESVHGRALVFSGLTIAPTCADCHGGHGIFPHTDSRSTVSQGKVPETCGSCHRYIVEKWVERSAHGQGWKKGEDVPNCITCHTSHSIEEPRIGIARLKFPETCGGCHGESYSSYRDSFHGQATDLGFITAATCSDCHTPHENLPVEDPESSVSSTNLQKTCGKCHGKITPDFATFNPHLDPKDPDQNRNVHYIWLFMNWLIICVFGFFGIHTLLWFQRSLVGLLRGEFKTIKRESDEYFLRFTPVQQWIHVTIVVTFLMLAASGLPLKFHFSGWADTLSGFLGGISIARGFHRFAAVLTFGYAFFFIGYVLYLVFVKKKWKILSGWRSLTVRGKDFKDLFNNFRWFLYLGPRPKLDRWTYWEKFDFYAVFWGVPVIGISGLILWFPKLFSQFLPGWALNASYIIHSDEATLAIGFIFLFHFFHNHLRPENFPLDPVIFTGRLPLERFIEERPVEYERMVKSGELKKRLVGPPSNCHKGAAYIFGFITFGIGILLIIAILWTTFA
jgi:cytochrome b subunit of formate dehydrogenase